MNEDYNLYDNTIDTKNIDIEMGTLFSNINKMSEDELEDFVNELHQKIRGRHETMKMLNEKEKAESKKEIQNYRNKITQSNRRLKLLQTSTSKRGGKKHTKRRRKTKRRRRY
jgi:uncharacterized protein YecA (UPF0149 family)